MNDSLSSKGPPGQERLCRELGKRIVQARQRRGWKQADLAKRLEVPRERLGRWEQGRNAPSLEDLAALSEVLEMPLGDLGVGRCFREVLSSMELAELLSHFTAMGRLLKPLLVARKK
ncbi:MAG TPA: helix-turn-helix transcriptional regulator [Thermoanaerobaculia bacterium]|jgi:transcriptional regulator with XRE-family HTH domain|nr:helix-turn-helix transcriptional regulator [Thermoanaerobaculia bacterium]